MRQIPAVPSLKRQETLGIRWIIESARKRRKKNYKPFFQCLAEELLDAFQNQGEPHKENKLSIGRRKLIASIFAIVGGVYLLDFNIKIKSNKRIDAAHTIFSKLFTHIGIEK
jgi:hypothetical protein